jgi:hypothetical protein
MMGFGSLRLRPLVIEMLSRLLLLNEPVTHASAEWIDRSMIEGLGRPPFIHSPRRWPEPTDDTVCQSNSASAAAWLQHMVCLHDVSSSASPTKNHEQLIGGKCNKKEAHVSRHGIGTCTGGQHCANTGRNRRSLTIDRQLASVSVLPMRSLSSRPAGNRQPTRRRRIGQCECVYTCANLSAPTTATTTAQKRHQQEDELVRC